uniref:Alkylated DNA repair protein AlkB homologue 8 N-terminal domain-containing protein n=1 Tax=Hucho hucho TaxID=62062 RepID=A0A4W5P3B0_9TELE
IVGQLSLEFVKWRRRPSPPADRRDRRVWQDTTSLEVRGYVSSARSALLVSLGCPFELCGVLHIPGFSAYNLKVSDWPRWQFVSFFVCCSFIDLSFSFVTGTHSEGVVKKAQQHLFNLRRLKKFGLSPKTLTNFYRCTIESILSGCITAWYSNCTVHNRRALQRVVRSAQRITGRKLPPLQATYSTQCHRKAKKIIKDNNHPSYCLFTPLLSRRRGQYRCIKAGTERLKNSFYLKVITAKQPSLAQKGCCQQTDLNHRPLLIMPL